MRGERERQIRKSLVIHGVSKGRKKSWPYINDQSKTKKGSADGRNGIEEKDFERTTRHSFEVLHDLCRAEVPPKQAHVLATSPSPCVHSL